MAGVARLEGRMIVSTPLGDLSFPGGAVQSSEAVTAWVGPTTVSVPTATSEQSLVVLGTQGLTTITDFFITSDQDISVTYGTAVSNVPVALGANKFHALCGTSLTAISVTNTSGESANVTYFASGA